MNPQKYARINEKSLKTPINSVWPLEPQEPLHVICRSGHQSIVKGWPLPHVCPLTQHNSYQLADVMGACISSQPSVKDGPDAQKYHADTKLQQGDSSLRAKAINTSEQQNGKLSAFNSVPRQAQNGSEHRWPLPISKVRRHSSRSGKCCSIDCS